MVVQRSGLRVKSARPSGRAKVSAIPSDQKINSTGGEAADEASEDPRRAMEIG
jgi:hypothetical protein